MLELTHDGIIRETDDAVLFNFDESKIWIPKSIIKDYDDLVIEVPNWFVEKAELEGYVL
jgi:hypothetical protein